MNDEDDFLSYCKRPLTAIIIAKIILRKKRVKFTKFNGMQDPKMHVRKFQKEVIEYEHDRDSLTKLFSYNLKDEALKWYFQLPKNSIDKYKDLIHLFLHNFSNNIPKNIYFKDLYKIKQLPNKSVKEFINIWNQMATKISMPK